MWTLWIACRPEPPAEPTEPVSPAHTADTAHSGVPDALRLDGVEPAVVDPLGGSHLRLDGEGLDGAIVTIDGIEVPTRTDDGALRVVTPPLAGPAATLRVARGDLADEATLDVWSPAELPGARVFDAGVGVDLAGPVTSYEWQRLTPSIAPGWRARDGNTLSWVPTTQRWVMVGGWNGYQEPDGFSPVPPDTVSPPLNTTDEVWSSADGVTWTNDLPHGHGAFERRHSHVARWWRGALWVVGGDFHQGFHNHDVLSSPDGVQWTEVLPPGTPPWEPRSLQISGVFDGDLWTMGGEASGHFYNDVWRSDDGVNWDLVAPDDPAAADRWAGCGAVDGVVEFRGRMWLVGCGRDTSGVDPQTRAEVWSTADGATWTRHADPPWAGKIWHNVIVWDDHLWTLLGFTLGDPDKDAPVGQYSEAWWSDDGETWTRLPPDLPVPGSHAQGIDVHDDTLLLAGGNYTYGFGDGIDPSVWRLVPFRGDAVTSWTDRATGLEATAPDAASRPVRVEDAFGEGAAGLQFDGSTSQLALEGPDLQVGGRTVWWVARMPWLPNPYAWAEDQAPVGTVVGGPAYTWGNEESIGMSEGALSMVVRAPDATTTRVTAGAGLQVGPGEVHVVGMSHAVDGAVLAWVDGAAVTPSGAEPYGDGRSWSRIGSGVDGDGYYGPNTRFAGTLGAVIVWPEVADEATASRVAAWARGRFPR